MFCVNCGTAASGNQSFCRNCGRPLKKPDAPAASVTPQAPPAAAPTSAHASGRCAWCGAGVDLANTSCPNCGAALNVTVAKAQSGWMQMPARKDMTKLQIGSSSCQIEGVYVPVADMNLAAGDGVYFTHHVLLWKEPQVNITTMPLKGGWKRLFGGLPLIMTQAAGPGHIAFSKDDPGEVIPVALQPGRAIDVREHMLLAATSDVAYDFFMTNIWFETQNGNDTETHYPVGCFMDRFSTGANPGLLLLHAGGNIFVRELVEGQTILVKPTALVFKDPTVQMQLHFEHPSMPFTPWRSWSNRYLWLRLSGPGRVAIQSVFERIEGESRNMKRWSAATAARW
ncbi:MAG: AIM24 family protein [Bryobacteraceae bacterium]